MLFTDHSLFTMLHGLVFGGGTVGGDGGAPPRTNPNAKPREALVTAKRRGSLVRRPAPALALLVAVASGACGEGPPEPRSAAVQIEIPEAMRLEHEEIHGALVAATEAPGAVGEAARALAEVLHPHFVREEQIALPPLGLLGPLARGEYESSMREVLAMTDSLEAEWPKMLREHEAIAAAAARLEEVARAEGNVEAERVATTLQAHAKTEEDVNYPAAILVGRVVRMLQERAR